MKLVMLGPPGAGKGTQAQILSERLEIPTISTGALLREEIRKGSPLGKQADLLMQAGNLVPDEMVNAILMERLNQEDCLGGFILDGYPRAISQAKTLSHITQIDAVLYIHVDDQEIISRLSGRRVCQSCGATYHTQHQPSTAGDLCERCGGTLALRSDDRPETVQQRLEVYHQQTAPLVEYYKSQGLLRTVVGQYEIEATTEMTMRALGEQP